ncbi:MAG: glycosyltransferase family A protein [Chloroflexota bacterium]
MRTITIVSAPKPFTEAHIAMIQSNAIHSWSKLEGVEVLLMGDEPGMAEAAEKFGVHQVPDVPCSETGVPLINGMFDRARQESAGDLLAFVNADIILLPDFIEASRRIADLLEKFLMVGQRWNLDVGEEIDFASGYADRLRKLTWEQGSLHTLKASDYFVFPRGLFTEVPDLLVGRAGWDNWMMYYGTTQPWPAVDATTDVVCIHQNHDYAHLPNARPHYGIEESQINVRLAGGWRHMYELIDVNKRLENGSLRPQKYRLARWLHKIELLLEPQDRQGKRWTLTRYLRRFRNKVMSYGA